MCVPLFNVAAVWPMARHAQTGFVRALARNPLIIATVAGLLAQRRSACAYCRGSRPALSRIGDAALAAGPDGGGRRACSFGALAQRKALAAGAARDPPRPVAVRGRSGWRCGLRLTRRRPAVLIAFSAVADLGECLCAGRAHGLATGRTWRDW